MITAFAPGRVNLIGEHTDYNEGLALPFAIEEGVTVTARRRGDGRVVAIAEDLGARREEFALDAIAETSGWAAFVRGAAAELQRTGIALVGADLRIVGTVARGAGLSSSAALEVALALALVAVAGAGVPPRREVARLCSEVENRWVGAHTGLMDQLASLYGERDRALRIDFRTLEVEPVALELGGYRLVTLDSGESHNLAGSGYNERRAECVRACELLGVSSLRDASLEAVAELPAPLADRARHVIEENGRVEATVAALRAGDLERVGELLDASHASLRDLYDISTPAVEAAVRHLKSAGALGARIVGGGFGGSVLGLLAPGTDGPDGAIEVRPGEGARVEVE